MMHALGWRRTVIKKLGLAAALAILSCGASQAAGAIAVDTEQGQKAGDEGYGIGWGSSRAEAAAKALASCAGAGNDSCKVVARFDSCGAFASNRSTYGVGWGATEGDAKSMALGRCDENCRIVIAECE